MANFFDDDDGIDDETQQESIPRAAAAAAAAPPTLAAAPLPRAGPSRSRSNSPSLPPPLRLQQQQDVRRQESLHPSHNNANVKGKGRETSSSSRNGHAFGGGGVGGDATQQRQQRQPQRQQQQQPQRHARATSEFSMDIEDNDNPPRRRNAGALTNEEGEDDPTDDQNEESDIQRLTRLYMDERQSPELLKFPEESIDTLMENLEAQSEAASVLISSGISAQAEQHERLLLVQMEIERVRWLMRSYFRTRTFKIEKQATYLLKTPLAKAKLSDVEKGYAERYLILVHRHFQNSVTQNLPDRLGRLDEEEMVVRPELDQAVFARARKDCPPIRLPDGQMIEMRKGEIHLVRYRSIRRLLKDGDVRLV